jgi:hypothetical protein
MSIDYLDYRFKTSMPIRDMHNDGKIVFVVDIYGWTASDVCVVPGGSDPMLKAVRRLGLDPERYQAVIWDANVGADAPARPAAIRRAIQP